MLCWLICLNLCGEAASQVDFIWEKGSAVGVWFNEFSDVDYSDWIVTLAYNETSIFGRWSKNENTIIFHPAIPFRHDQTYLIRSGGERLQEFKIPALDAPLTRLVRIYPSIDTVPENLLKMHIQFSAPMGERYSEEFLTVTDELGDTLKNIFLPLQPELWNDDHDRLTLWLDPGRIKRGLGPNLAQGQPLEMGQTYTIRIGQTWKDRRGRPLEKGRVIKLFAGEAIRDRLNPEEWQPSIPASDSKQPLVLKFTNPLDRVLGQECISVIHGNILVKGKVSLAQQELEWHFVPLEEWVAGTYILRIESRLEDLAGNNTNRPFDRDISSNDNVNEKEYYDLSFEIK